MDTPPSSQLVPSSKLYFSPLLGSTSGSNDKARDKRIDKRLLTPCRRVGLKRKSLNCNIIKEFKDDGSPKSSLPNSRSHMEIATKNLVLPEDSISVPLCPENRCEPLSKQINVEDTRVNVNNNKVAVSDDNAYMCSLQQNSSKTVVDSGLSCKRTKQDITVTDKPEPVTLEVLESLANSIKQKKEKCRHIKLSCLYAKKHDLKMLKELTLKWKEGCQNALYELQTLLREKGQSLPMSALLSQFKIPYDVIDFNEDNDEFE